MIHSLAGGSFKEKRILDFCKVEIIENICSGMILWYICEGLDLMVGDKVIVPVGRNNSHLRAKVLRVDKSCVEGQTPVPLNMAKEVIRKI